MPEMQQKAQPSPGTDFDMNWKSLWFLLKQAALLEDI
jgi:hypothetical protein